MAGEWHMVPLGEVTINHDAKRIPVKESERQRGPYPYYGASGIVDHVDSYLFDGEYLLVAEDGENLRTRQTPIAFMATGKFWVNNHAHIVKGNHQARTRYVAYALAATDIAPYLTGAVMPKLTQRNLDLIPLPIPSIPEQDKIVSLLGALDKKIDLGIHLAETLGGMVRALFKSWFVNFDPVRAKTDGRPTDLSADLSALFPDSFGEDGLPTGWELKPIGEIFEIRGGNTPRTDDAAFWDGEYHWATPKDLSSATFPVLLQTNRSLTDAGLQQVSSGLLPIGSLLLSTRAPIGYMAIAAVPTAINQGFAGFVRTKTSTAYAWAWCTAHIDTIAGNAGGSTFPEISKAVLRQLPMLAPSQSVLDAFGAIVDPLIGRITVAAREAQTLASLRDTLLPKLISGELRIADAEKRIVAA